MNKYKKYVIVKAKLVNESMFEKDYDEAAWKMDTFMPEDLELQNEYYEILDNKDLSTEEKYNILTEFLQNFVSDGDRMYSYFPQNGTIEEFAKYLVDKYE